MYGKPHFKMRVSEARRYASDADARARFQAASALKRKDNRESVERQWFGGSRQCGVP